MEQNTPHTRSIDINWTAAIRKLLASKKFILKWSIAIAIMAIIIALLQKREYSVTAQIAPEASNSALSGAISSVTSMLGMGSALNSEDDAINIYSYPDVLQSTPFLLDVLETPVSDQEGNNCATYVEYLKLSRSWQDRTSDFFSGLKNKLRPQKKDLPGAGGSVDERDYIVLTRKVQGQVDDLREKIAFDMDQETGVSTITFVEHDPIVCTIMCDAVCQKLKQYVIRYRTHKANEDLVYYEDMATEASDNLRIAQLDYACFIDKNKGVTNEKVNSERTRLENEVALREQLYMQMVQQRELSRAKLQEKKPAFVFIEPAVAPSAPKTSKAKTAILWFTLGMVLVCSWVISKDKIKQGWHYSRAAINRA